MIAQERYQVIINILDKEGIVNISSLCQILNTSSETVRRDLTFLEQEGKLKKLHGGAMLVGSPRRNELSFKLRDQENLSFKYTIAQLAKEFISEDESLMFDISSTSYHLAEELLEFNNLVLITNSLVIINLLLDTKVKVIALGGELKQDPICFASSQTLNELKNIYAHKVFFSCYGLDMQLGLMDLSEDICRIKEKMLSNATKRYFLLDHTKFGVRGVIKFGDWDMVDCIITDVKPSDEWCEFLSSKSIELVYQDSP